MVERVFPPDDAGATTAAADLAERILDEITRRDHDWKLIAAEAAKLADLAALMAAAA